jgi:zinc transport system substrate-binding protein
MVGRGVPDLLLEGHVSPHTTALKPSQTKLIHNAQLLVWVGPSFEVFLKKTAAGLPKDNVLTLLEVPEMVVLHASGCHHEDHGCAHHGMHSQGHGAENVDGHIWLDPHNALIIAKGVLQKLVALDGAGQSIYEKNFQDLREELKVLDEELREKLSPYKNTPFFVVHPAYGYLIARYGLQQPSTLLARPESLMSPQNMLALGDFLAKNKGGSVFFEPQFAAIFEKLRPFVKLRGGKIGKLDPLGVDEAPGPGLYCVLLRRCATNMVGCFSNG